MRRVPMFFNHETHKTYAMCAAGKDRFKDMYLWQEVHRTIFGFFVKAKKSEFWLDDYGFTYIGCGKFCGELPYDNPNLCE